MDRRWLAIIGPRVPARRPRGDAITLHTYRPVVYMSERESLENEIGLHICSKPLDDPFHAAQIAKSLLAGVCHIPNITCRLNLLLTQHPQQTKQRRDTQRIIAQPGAKYS